jgi:hypothetical protein
VKGSGCRSEANHFAPAESRVRDLRNRNAELQERDYGARREIRLSLIRSCISVRCDEGPNRDSCLSEFRAAMERSRIGSKENRDLSVELAMGRE